MASQPKTLEAIFNPERTGRNKNKKRNSHRRDGQQEGSICNKQVERQWGTWEAGLLRGKRWGGKEAQGQPQLCKYFTCLCCRGVGSGWSVTFLLLALGHEFKSHTGFKLRADFAVTLPLSVQRTKRTSKRWRVKENRKFPQALFSESCEEGLSISTTGRHRDLMWQSGRCH